MTTPTIRRLKTITMEDKNLNIRKITIGKPNPNDTGAGKVLMVLGATGAGKSTLINGMVNYIMGVQYEDDHRYKLIDDEGPSQAKSQTKRITAYTFYKQDNSTLPYTLTVIDTPGYGDTEGIERDRQINKQIKEFFSLEGPQGIDHLDGIGFVVKAPDCRLTPTQRYIFESILCMFGKDFSKNIFLMITFTDGTNPPVLTAIKEANIEYQKAFKFNNSALFTKIEDQCDDDSDDDYDSMSFSSMYWEIGEKSFKHFFKIFKQAQCVSLQLTKEVLQEREHLECTVEGIQQNIQAVLSKKDQLYQEERIIEKHKNDLLTNKDFVYKVKIPKQRLVNLKTGEYVTNCLKCNMTCHYPCCIPNDADKAKCAAMNKQGNCTCCPGKCYWNEHKNNEHRFEQYVEEETRNFDDLKRRYYQAESEKTAKEKITAGIKKELHTLDLAAYGLTSEAHKIICRLDEIALRPNPLSEIQYIDLLIAAEKQQGKPGFQQRIDSLHKVRQQAEIVSKVKKEKGKTGAFHSALKTLKLW